MRKPSNKPAATPEMLKSRLMISVREYSQLTGIPTPTVYSYVTSGKIAGVVRVGCSIHIPVATLQAQLAGASPVAVC
jgi:hypothetical protein